MHRTAVSAISLLLALASAAQAAVTPLKPHDQLVHEVYQFLVSDVGNNGIRTMDGLPGGDPVPPYFYHFAIKHNDNLNSSTTGYPGWASISYPGYTASIGVDAFLAYWAYTGDPQALQRARDFADWLIPRRTPAGDLYGNWVYSTQTDGVMGGGFDGDAVMSDKPGMFGLRCVRLFDVTGQTIYMDTAREIADTYVATQMTGGPEDAGRWPFRVRPSDGLVRQDYTSHLIPTIRLLKALEPRFPGNGYGTTADNAWDWLFANPLDPSSVHAMHWEGFYEDTTPAVQTGYWDHYSAESTLIALVERDLPGDLAHAISIMDWSTNRYLSPDNFQNGSGTYAPALLEWDLWPNTTYAATGQWAHANLVLHEATLGLPEHDATWKARALEALHTITYGQGTEALPADDRMITTIRELTQPTFGTDTWYEQNFNTVIYVLAGMGIATELAPADENHLLRFFGGELQSVQYDSLRIDCQFSAAGQARFKLIEEPFSVKLGGAWYPSGSGTSPGWTWDPATQLLEVDHPGGEMIVHLGGVVASEPARSTVRLFEAFPNPANPSTRIDFELSAPGPVELSIFDVSGRRIRDLLRAERPSGRGSAAWDGRDAAGRPVASGVYHLRLRAGTFAQTRRIVLVR